jgi:hypothetical protein
MATPPGTGCPAFAGHDNGGLDLTDHRIRH